MSAVKQPSLQARDFISDPQVLRQQLTLLYGLRNLNVQLVTFTAAAALTPSQSQIIGNPPNLTLPLPLIAPNGKWTVPTGTFTRSSFATGSVTVAQLAERVAALEQDLMAIGILSS